VSISFTESAIKKMKMREEIQYTVISANKKVMVARIHFRARLCNPLVLFHYEKYFRKKSHQVDCATDGLHHSVDCDGKEAQIYAWDTWRTNNQPRIMWGKWKR
jgi:hypothetical protein